jgi:uncharacterized membrane protein
MFLNTVHRSVLIGGWLAILTAIVIVSVAMDASRSTTALLLLLGVAPGIVVMLIARGAPSPSVTQILNALETKDRRL